MAFKLTDLSDRGPDTSSQQFTHFNSFRSVRAMFCIFAGMCCFLCYIIGDKTDQNNNKMTNDDNYNLQEKVLMSFIQRHFDQHQENREIQSAILITIMIS